MRDLQQFRQLFDAHSRALCLYARQLCDDPDDVVQEAYLKLAEQPVPPPEPAAWLFRVVRHEALMVSRSQRRRRQREAAFPSTGWFEPLDSDAIDVRELTAALESLAREDRELVTARIWGGLNFRELGELLSISDSSAHRRYAAALESLRKHLGVSCLKPH
jgi:RNA polymerase sigma factor (sigma-70 family)